MLHRCHHHSCPSMGRYESRENAAMTSAAQSRTTAVTPAERAKSRRIRGTVSCLAALLLASCATVAPFIPTPTPVREGQEKAAWIIWRSFLREDPPPTVRWVEGAGLNCTINGGGGFQTPVGCRQGFTWTPFNVTVAWRDGDEFSTTAMAHEYEHAKQARQGIVDPEHTRPEWLPGGEVDHANTALQAEGL